VSQNAAQGDLEVVFEHEQAATKKMPNLQ